MKNLSVIFNPIQGNDWEQFQADEEAREKAIQYVLDGRLWKKLTSFFQPRIPLSMITPKKKRPES